MTGGEVRRGNCGRQDAEKGDEEVEVLAGTNGATVDNRNALLCTSDGVECSKYWLE